MAFRIVLQNSLLGTHVVDDGDPVGINDIEKKIARSAQFEGVIHTVSIDLKFQKAAREFIKRVYENAGRTTALLIVGVFRWNPNARDWEPYFEGKGDFNTWELDEDLVTINIERTGIQSIVLNKMESDVDLNTDTTESGAALVPQSIITSEWHSKIILKEGKFTSEDDAEFQQLNAGTLNFPGTGEDIDVGIIWYAQLDNSNAIFDEIDESFNTPFGFTAFSNIFFDDQLNGVGTDEKYIDFLTNGTVNDGKLDRNPMFQMKEAGVTDIDVKLRVKARIVATNEGGDVDVGGEGALGTTEVYLWAERRDRFNNILFIEKIGQLTMVNGVSGFETKLYEKNDIDGQVGDKYYFYGTYRVWGEYEAPVGASGQVIHDLYITIDPEESYIDVKSETITQPTSVKSIMIHEAVERSLQYITNQPVCFYSTLLGRTDIGYDVDGEFSLISITNGNWIRGRDAGNDPEEDNILILDRVRLTSNFKQLYDFINSKMCVGFGFEVMNGKMVLRLEKLDYFYRKDVKILSLGKVYKPVRKVDATKFFNRIEYGFNTKLDIKTINAIDEPNSLRKANLAIDSTDKELKISSSVITGSYPIEYQRRLRGTSEDGTYDDDLFAVWMYREGESFRPLRNEGYEAITNFFSPDTAYNLPFAPGALIKNWDKVVAACLVGLPDKVVKFSSGTVNYRMTSKKFDEFVVIENANRDLSAIEPHYELEKYIIEQVEFDADMCKLVELNPFGYIEFEDQTGEIFHGFLNENGIVHSDFDGTASIELKRVHRKTA